MKGTDKLNIEYIEIDKLKPYKRNNKKHGDFDIGEIAKLIEKYGMNDPIGIWKDNQIIEGHGRLEACKKLGIVKVPCIRLDHLTDKERREYAILHNKTAELAEYDFDNLAAELPDLDFSDFDFEIDPDDNEETKIIEDEAPEVDEEHESTVKLGDIWQLGRHRLMCGDSTNDEMLERLMNGEIADCVITDPPYNMRFEGAGGSSKAKRQKSRILNDSLSKEKFENFLLAIYKNMYKSMADGASFYVFYKELGDGTFLRLLWNCQEMCSRKIP